MFLGSHKAGRFSTSEMKSSSRLQAVAAPRGGLGGIRPPPNSQKSAKIVKEKWHKISMVYL